MKHPKISAVQVFLLQPPSPDPGIESQRLVVVKVTTDEPGLYGLGCGTFTQRDRAVQAAIEHHVGPYVLGRNVHEIDDLWFGAVNNGYWRNGGVIGNAVSGIDMALWDIKGKLAGMPCYELWGGKCRAAAAVYGHANGNNAAEVVENARVFMERGYTHVRLQLGKYVGTEGQSMPRAEGALPGDYFCASEKLRQIPELFAFARKELGDKVELIHDVHERLAPCDAVWLAKALEPYRLFFLEDVLSPEDCDWLANIRAVCATPIAMGELFNNPREYIPLIANRLIDFIRIHVSQIGGITPALKLAHLCESFGVRTAWHGPMDTSPVGMAANVHLDLASRSFGIQEWGDRHEVESEIFPGMPEVRKGYAYANSKPGLGIEFNEELATRFPSDSKNPTWTVARLPDGSLWRP